MLPLPAPAEGPHHQQLGPHVLNGVLPEQLLSCHLGAGRQRSWPVADGNESKNEANGKREERDAEGDTPLSPIQRCGPEHNASKLRDDDLHHHCDNKDDQEDFVLVDSTEDV